MARRVTPKSPRQRLPMPLQRPWVETSKKAEDERTRARRKIRPWQRPEETE